MPCWFGSIRIKQRPIDGNGSAGKLYEQQSLLPCRALKAEGSSGGLPERPIWCRARRFKMRHDLLFGKRGKLQRKTKAAKRYAQ